MIKKGFTLIELLITISIIGVLSSIAIFAVSGVRESARDSRRRSDLEAIRQALELFRSDNGEYPDALNELVSVYIEAVPTDPSDSSVNYLYCPTDVSGSNLRYSLYSRLEDESISAISPDCSACSGGDCRVEVNNP